MLHVGALLTKVETIAWATPREGMSLTMLAHQMNELGNVVLEIDEANNRLKLLHVIDELGVK